MGVCPCLLFFKPAKNPKTLSISLESSMLQHCTIQFGFAVVAKWRVTNVVRQCSQFYEVRVDVMLRKIRINIVQPYCD